MISTPLVSFPSHHTNPYSKPSPERCSALRGSRTILTLLHSGTRSRQVKPPHFPVLHLQTHPYLHQAQILSSRLIVPHCSGQPLYGLLTPSFLLLSHQTCATCGLSLSFAFHPSPIYCRVLLSLILYLSLIIPLISYGLPPPLFFSSSESSFLNELLILTVSVSLPPNF